MSAITDASPAHKPSRYRTIRGRNVPESQRAPATSADDTPARPPAPPVSRTLRVGGTAQRDAAAEQLLAEQKRKDLERLQRQLASHQPSAPAKLPKTPKATGKSSALDKLSFLRRRPPPPPPVPVSASVPEPAPAPPSAPAGSRTIVIRFKQFAHRALVHADTTAGDLLRQCADVLPGDWSEDAYALAEQYGRLGLERRLRRYERIRDVLDSWDRDSDNVLAMVPTAAGAGVRGDSIADSVDLGLSGVPADRHATPDGIFFLQMYHAHKPGRWTKRYISLVPATGQLVASKKADASRLASFIANEQSATGSDWQSLCRLSDYDVYGPTEAEMRRHLKPPKRHCFAARSQQRTTVFVNTDNYVHFFCVDDPAQARAFFTRVFAWRSWYLVHRRLGLRLGSPTASSSTPQPLVDRTGRRGRTNTGTGSADGATDFAADGLLGTAYEQRRLAEAEAYAETAPRCVPSQPFVEGSLLDRSRSTRRPAGPSRPTSSSSDHPVLVHRSASLASRRTRGDPPPYSPDPPPLPPLQRPLLPQHPRMPAPLIDLRPKFQEAPQWSTENRGHGVRAPPGTAHLIDLATQPSLQDPLPSETLLRRDEAAAYGPPPPSRHGTIRAKTMTSASAAAAAGFARHHTVHRSRGGQPPVPLLARIPDGSGQA